MIGDSRRDRDPCGRNYLAGTAVQVSAQLQAAQKAAPEVKTEKNVPAHRGVNTR